MGGPYRDWYAKEWTAKLEEADRVNREIAFAQAEVNVANAFAWLATHCLVHKAEGLVLFEDATKQDKRQILGVLYQGAVPPDVRLTVDFA